MNTLEDIRARSQEPNGYKSNLNTTTTTRTINSKNQKAKDEFEKEKQKWRLSKKKKSEGEKDESMDDEELAIAKARRLQQENKESLNNSIKKAREATEIGANTIEKLEKQREQLTTVDTDLDLTNASFERSSRTRRSVGTFGGSILNYFAPRVHHKNKTLDPSAIQVSPSHSLPHSRSTEEIVNPTPSLNDIDYSNTNLSEKASSALSEFKSNENRENQQIDELGDLLLQLKGQGEDMNKELKVHSKLIENVENELNAANARSGAASKSVKKILKNA